MGGVALLRCLERLRDRAADASLRGRTVGSAVGRFEACRTVAPRRARSRGSGYSGLAGEFGLAAARRCCGTAPRRTVGGWCDGNQGNARRFVLERGATERRGAGAASGTIGIRAAVEQLALLVVGGAGSGQHLRFDAQ